MLAWKKREDRKPLVLKGVRQVGKTWLMLEFGKKYYTNYVYFNLCEDDKLKPIFENNKNPEEIVEHLSLIGGKKILPEKTLIIFDEIHDCPEAFRALQYFGRKQESIMSLLQAACLVQCLHSQSFILTIWSIY